MDTSRAAPASEPASRAAGHPAWEDPAWRRWVWLVPGVLLVALGLITVGVLSGGPIVSFDQRVRAHVIAKANSPAWVWLIHGHLEPAQRLTDLGSITLASVILGLCALAAAVRSRSLRPLLAAGLGMLLLLGTVVPAKMIIRRPGPGYSSLGPGQLGVFPSGHTATACICYGLAVLLITAGMPHAFRWTARLAVAAVCFAVGVALVWCDYHYVSDVVAAWVLSAAIDLIVWRAYLRLPGRQALRSAIASLRNRADGS